MAGFVKWLRAEWDRAAGVGFLVVGAICLAVGYSGVAGATYVPEALSFIASGGFFGLFLVAVGSTLLITAALHDEWRKLDRIEQAIDRLAQTDTPVVLDAGSEDRNSRSPAPPASAPERSSPGASQPAVAASALRFSALAGLVAAVLVAGGWVATASAVDDTTAYATVLLGIAGLAVAGTASTGWTLSLRRANRQRQAHLLAPFGAALALAGGGPGAAPHRVAVADGLTRFHTPGCAAVSGLAVRLVDPDHAARSGLAACPLCEPRP